MSKVFLTYTLIISGVAIWWMLAFQPHSPSILTFQHPSPVSSTPQSIPLSPLDRETLKKALAGDFALMGHLMAEWDIDAQLLQDQGNSVNRLSSDRFTRGQYLSRSLKKNRSNDLKFLPQSYAAASILLALVPPSQIVALPKGYRRQKLFPESVTGLIPEDVDRFNSEKLFLARPDIAFVSSHYSHPAAIDALRIQGIAIVKLNSLDSVPAIQEAISQIGQVSKNDSKAELLNIFIDASLIAIDNRRKTVEPSKTLYLNYYTQFTTPSRQTFTYEQLKLLALEPERFGLNEAMPIDQERLLAINPDCLIISTLNPMALKVKLEREPAYQGLKAVQHRRVHYLDDDVQQAASQYAVLAYFDIIHALTGSL